MKSRRSILLFLVGLNLCQVVVIGYLLKRNLDAPSSSPQVNLRAKPEPLKKVVPVAATFNWSNMESADYKAYITNLRAIGCPEETVRDIIIADVDKLFASRMQAGVASQKREWKYWEPDPGEWSEVFGEEKWKQERAVEKEKRVLLKELLGIDIKSERRKIAGGEDIMDKRLHFLPVEKREQVKSLLEKFAEQEQNFREQALEQGGGLSAEDRAELEKIRAARQAELAKILSPQEIELFELWTSDAAIAARHALGGLDDPGEKDFLAIYKSRKRFEEKFNSEFIDLEDPATREKLEKATTETEDQIKAQLGEERYAQYQRGKDHDYRQLAELSRRYNLPPETSGKVYDVRKSAEHQTIKIQADESLSEEKRKSLIEEIRQSAGKTVQKLLGEEAYKHYRRTESAGWL